MVFEESGILDAGYFPKLGKVFLILMIMTLLLLFIELVHIPNM